MHRIAIVGAGPAGTSAALRLLKGGSRVNLFDRSLIPWGLLRTGVAPDHPEVKHTAQAWSTIGEYESFQYYGGVEIGKSSSQFKSKNSKSIDLSTLIANHDAVLLANGAYKARSLNLCQSSRIISAQEFVGWYNADPYFTNLKNGLNGFGGSIGIVGGGNVALDIARIVLDHKNLKSTDISSIFLKTIDESTDVNFFIRRGPFDLPCTTRELRELLTLPNVKLEILGLNGIPLSEIDQYKKLQKSRKLEDRKQKRLLKILADKESESRKLNQIPDDNRTIRFHFYHTPTKIQENNNSLSCYFVAKTEGIVEKKVNFLIESLGYNQTPIENEIQILDTSTGRGEYLDHTIYLAGWALSGAKGVVGDSTDSARRACESIIEDLSSRKPNQTVCPSHEFPYQGDSQTFEWQDWLKINDLEIKKGEELKKSREKFSSFSEMLKIIKKET